MSEPGLGSDLFAAKTKATETKRRLADQRNQDWTSNAHIADT